MFDVTNQIKPCVPRETFSKPRYTMTEEVNSLIVEMRSTIDRLLRFEERTKSEFDNLMHHLTSDNVTFKNVFNEGYNSFLNEVKNEVNMFESNLEATISLFKTDIEGNYSNLSEEVHSKLESGLAEFTRSVDNFITTQTDNFTNLKNSLQNQYDTYVLNTNNKLSIRETELNKRQTEFETNVNAEISNYQESINNDVLQFKNATNQLMNDYQTSINETVSNYLTPDGIEGKVAELDNEVSQLSSDLNELYFVKNVPFIKELYINELGVNAGIVKFHMVTVSPYQLLFADSNGDVVSCTLQYSEKPTGIIPVYVLNSTDYLYGYIIVNWDEVEDAIVDTELYSCAYELNYSPSIKQYLDSQTFNQSFENHKKANDVKYKNNVRRFCSKKTVNTDFSICTNQLSNDTALFTNGYIANCDSLLIGIETPTTVYRIGVYVAKGKYAESKEWRCYAQNVPVVHSIINEDVTGKNIAWVSSYNLEMCKGDEVYVNIESGIINYSDNTTETFNALADINADVMTVQYYVAYNLITFELEDYETQSENLGLNICVIGDSLTQGVDVYKHVIAESYPFFLSRFLGSRVLNYGQMGRTAQTWWNNYKDFYKFDSSVDVVLIMFGTNGGLTLNTLETDVEPYDNWHDYADTNCGCFCKLIEKIMDDTENHAQIILLTPPYSSYTQSQTETVIATESVVRAIAKRYNLPVIDVLNECGMGKFNATVFRPHDGCHFNAKGYHKLATFIGSKIKSIMSTFDTTDIYDDECTE